MNKSGLMFQLNDKCITVKWMVARTIHIPLFNVI